MYRVLGRAYFKLGPPPPKTRKDVRLMIMTFSRALRMVFINRRIIRAGRCVPRIAGAAGLLAGVFAAVASPAGATAAQAATCIVSLSTQTLVVTNLDDAGPGSLRAAIL